MDTLSTVLPIVLYVLLAALIVTLIILTVKIIQFVDRANGLVSNIDDKVNSLNRLFSVIDKMTDTLSIASDKIVDGISGFIMRIFRRKKRKDDEDYE